MYVQQKFQWGHTSRNKDAFCTFHLLGLLAVLTCWPPAILETLDSGCDYQMQEWDLDPNLSSSSLPKHKHKCHWNIENSWEALHFLCKELERICCSKFFHYVWCVSLPYSEDSHFLSNMRKLKQCKKGQRGWPVFSTHFFKEYLCAYNSACVTETSEIMYSFKRLPMSFWKINVEIIYVWKLILRICRIVNEENIISGIQKRVKG